MPLVALEMEVTFFRDALSGVLSLTPTPFGHLPHLGTWVMCVMCDNGVAGAPMKKEGRTKLVQLPQLITSLLKFYNRKSIY